MPAVLQGEACTFWRDASTKAHVIAVNQRARIPKSIHNREVNCIGAGKRNAMSVAEAGMIHVDILGTILSIGGAHEVIERDAAKRGIGHIPACVGEGEAK